jgi:hypothetical protein
MPKIRRHNLPPALFQHLLDRIQERNIPAPQLDLLARWLDSQPEVPEGEWYKAFSGMCVGKESSSKRFSCPAKVPGDHAFAECKSPAAPNNAWWYSLNLLVVGQFGQFPVWAFPIPNASFQLPRPSEP